MYFGQTVPGFPAHPHRGFETITIVREGVVDHSDSLGASARFGAGDVQWLTAGRGIVHAEMFPLLNRDKPNPLELFQVWLNLPARDKMVEPNFTMFWAAEIPRQIVSGSSGRTEVTCIVGTLNGVDMQAPPPPPPGSWAADPNADVAIWTLKMAPGAKWLLPPATRSGSRRQLFFFSGSTLTINGECIEGGSAIEVNCHLPIELANGSMEAEILLLQGRPIGERIVQHGPFDQVTGAGLNSVSALCSFQCSAQVFLPLATSSMSRNSSQPTSSMLASPVAIVPAFTSIRSCQRRARSERVATLITGTAARP